MSITIDHGKTREIGGIPYLVHHCGYLAQHLVNAHRVHLTAVVIATLNSLFQVASGSLCRQIIGDHLAVTALLLNPREVGHGYPKRFAVDGKADISSVRMASRDRYDGTLPN